MMTLLDELVITDSNREAFEAVVGITQAKEPQHLFIVGEEASGKTALLKARAADKDLLSTKRTSYNSATQMVGAVRFNVRDDFFERIGKVDVLLCDDFQDFYEDMEVGPMLCKLLLTERDRLGLDTVFTSNKPLSEYDLSAFEGALDGFTEMSVSPLTESERIVFVSQLRDGYYEEGKSPVLTDEAIAYLANDFAQDLADVRPAVIYLMTKSNFDAGEQLGAEAVKSVLTA